MRIIITIKSFLNYLYNNFIDLLNVNKIKFSDGTEMETVPKGNSLFDIKILSQAIADKGFAFMCKTVRPTFSKNNCPTMYNKLFEIYEKSDKETYQSGSLSGSPFLYNSFCFKNGYLYCIRRTSPNDSDWRIQKTYAGDNGSSLSSPIWETVIDQRFYSGLEFGICYTDKWILLVEDLGYGDTLTLYFISYTGTIIKQETLPRYSDIFVHISLSLVDDVVYVVNQENATDFKMYKIKVEDTINIEEYKTLNKWITNIQKHNNKLYFIYDNRGSNSSLGVTENDFDDFTVLCRCGGSYAILDKVIITENFNGTGAISYDGGLTFTEQAISYSRFNKFHLTEQYICQNGTTVYYTRDLINYTAFSGTGTGGDTLLISDNDRAIISANKSFYSANYFATQPILYTDTYDINGTVVTINYVKYNDFKIVPKEVATYSNLATILTFMGYYMYFVLDKTNQEFELPQNSQPFTLMYVGDNFIDSLDNLNLDSVRCLPQPQEINITDDSITVDLKPNTNYKFSHSLITDITFNSAIDSSLETYIKFTTGNSAPTLTDNSNIVWADGQPILQANKTYQIVIVDLIAYYKEI